MRTNQMYKHIALVLTLLCLTMPASAASNLIFNPDFEVPMVLNFIPGWVVFTGSIGHDIVIEEGVGYVSHNALAFYITDEEQRVGLRSSPELAVPGQTYAASVYVNNGTRNRVTLYLDFWNHSKQRIAHKTVSTTTNNEWEELKVSLTAPEDALFVSIILYSSSGNMGTAYFDQAALYVIGE